MGKQCDAIVLRTNCSTVPPPSLKACPINGRDHLSSYQSYSQDAAIITSVLPESCTDYDLSVTSR